MSIPTLRYRRGTLAAATLTCLLALSACGGGSTTDTTTPPPAGNTPPPPVATGDSFFAYVMTRVGALLDNDEPAAIDAVTETKPDNTEPEPVGS